MDSETTLEAPVETTETVTTEATEIQQPETPAAPQDDEVSTLRSLTRAAIEREQRLQAEIDAMRMANRPQPTVEEPTEEEFQANPFATLKKLIASQQAPIRGFVEQQQRIQNFNTEFNNYAARTPAIAPYAEQIRQQLAQNFIGSDMPINQSTIDVHTNALIGRMVMQSATLPNAGQPTASAPVVPPTPPKPRAASRPADPVTLTESQIRTKKAIDPDGKIWPDNKSFLDYLSSDERIIPL